MEPRLAMQICSDFLEIFMGFVYALPLLVVEAAFWREFFFHGLMHFQSRIPMDMCCTGCMQDMPK